MKGYPLLRDFSWIENYKLKISVDLILNSPNLLLSDWIPVLYPLSFLDARHENNVLQ